jgi:hypothetical protein
VISLLHSLRRRQLQRSGADRKELLSRTLRRLERSRSPGAWSTLWTDAIYAWDNARWSAEEQYLAEVVRSAERAKSLVLECGSGLTTLLIGAVAARRGLHVHALEHNPEWQSRVSSALREFGLVDVTVHLAPLRDFGDFVWYDAPTAVLPTDFEMVVCDGPPEGTRGGRSGVLPVMRRHLAPDCVILLDDANRPAEQELLAQWVRDHGAIPQLARSSRGFARVRLSGA